MGAQLSRDEMLDEVYVTAVAETAKRIEKDMHESGTVVSYSAAIESFLRNRNATLKARHHFPGARESSWILEHANAAVVNYGINSKNTLFAQSLCPDEINHEAGDIGDLFTKNLGEVFHLGGLAGIPFTGRTGFGAFSAHVPQDGHLFILFAPHIGMSDTMDLGKYSRTGQHEAGTACGAACGALQHCLSGKHVPTEDELGSCPFDYQMHYIISEINKRRSSIEALEDEDDRQMELVNQVYDIVNLMMENIISTKFGGPNSKLILLGGIQINMPDPMPDYFQPRIFQIRNRDGSVMDLLDQTFNIPSNENGI